MSIPHASISGTAADLIDVLNQVVDKVIASITIPSPRLLRITTQDGEEFDVDLPDSPDRIMSGCAVTRTGTRQYTVAQGQVQAGGTVHEISNTVVTLSVPDGTNSRYDAVVIDSDGTVTFRTGTPGATPALPTLTPGDCVVTYVDVPPAATYADSFLPVVPDSQQAKESRVVVSANRTILAHQTVIIADTPTASGTFTITLPTPSTVEGRVFKVFDLGSAASKNIKIASASGQVNGAPNITLSTNYVTATFTAYNGNYYGG